MTNAPSPMSEHNPALQLVWDSTSLQNIAFCPRHYQLTQLEGWRGSSVDLEFGGYAASAWEMYQKLRLDGETKSDAQFAVLKWLMKETWPEDAQEPWGGRYEMMWHCTGHDAEGEKVPYKNAKSNAAKCPYSHKGKWFPDDAPDVCGECGAETESMLQYIPDHSAKNRETLIRTVLWYIEEQPEDLDDGLRPYAFEDGTPAVELSFKVPLPLDNPYGETYILAGHFDYIGTFGDEMFIVDNKTTTKTLTTKFFEGYNPHMQVDTYDLIGSLVFPDLPIKGVMLDAAQILVEGSNFGRHAYYKTEEQRQEHLDTIIFWIKQAEFLAEKYGTDMDWPMNKRNCWLCPFKGICSKSPGERDMYLGERFEQREPWNPMRER